MFGGFVNGAPEGFLLGRDIEQISSGWDHGLVKRELERHDWPALPGAVDGVRGLPRALQDLCAATDREAALKAARRVEYALPGLGQLSEASSAVASSLVHGLRNCSEHALDLVLGILSDIAFGFEPEEAVYGSASLDDCRYEIRFGFPVYIEVLESRAPVDVRTACIDLILMCGTYDPRLRERAVYFLETALQEPALEGHRGAIESSIAELAQLVGDNGS